MLTLDGRTGEGGGQLVRTAAALAALAGQALRVDNVRGNRRGGGGLRPQHVAALNWLAAATDAAAIGIVPGSTSFTFRPKHCCLPRGCSSPDQPVVLRAATFAASTSLMLQAVLPYLLFAQPASSSGSGDAVDAVHVALYGGTHVSGAPTFDYLDQVLFPALEAWLGVRVERTLVHRGWATGPAHTEAGEVRLVVHRAAAQGGMVPRMPALGEPALDGGRAPPARITAVDATVLAPAGMLDALANALVRDVAQDPVLSPVDAASALDVQFRTLEDSGHPSRVYVLLVARADGRGATGEHRQETVPVRRWGRDYLGTETVRQGSAGAQPKHARTTRTKGNKGVRVPASGSDFGPLCDRIARQVVRDLADDVARGGCGDVHLQDQVIVFQALAAGKTSFWRGPEGAEEDALREAVAKLSLGPVDTSNADDVSAPFGQGTLHAATARWVTASLLPGVRWSANGTVCEGVGWPRTPA